MSNRGRTNQPFGVGGFPNIGGVAVPPATGTGRIRFPGIVPIVRRILFGRQESVVVPTYKQSSGEYPFPTFQELRDNFTRDPDAFTSVNDLKGSCLSRGWNVSCNEEHPDAEEASDYLTQWLKYVRWGDNESERGFDLLASTLIQEMAWAGTTLLEMIGEYDETATINTRLEAFAQVQISSIWRYQRDYTGKLVAIWQWPQINPYPLTPQRYIPFMWNSIDRNPFGMGMMHAISQWKIGPNGEQIPPLIQTTWQLENDARKRMHRYASPRAMYGLKSIPREEAQKLADELADPEADASYVHNMDVDVKMDSPTSRGNFAAEMDYLQQRKTVGLGSMKNKLLENTGSFSYASSKTGDKESDVRVWDLQQHFAISVQWSILRRLLDQSGEFDSVLLDPQFNYNIPEEPEQYTVADVLNAMKPDPTTGQRVISIEEGRQILKDFASWPIQAEIDPNALNPITQNPMVTAPPDAQNQIVNAQERARHR